jgi:ligand-binding sensor domain-containing protein/signal transduction histidine kinase
LLLFQTAPLSEVDVVLRQFTTTDGLSGNIVESVVQDADGYLWIGSQGGLDRYDGYVFKSYANRPETGFQGVYVRDIEFSPDGRMWVLCAEGYLNEYDPDTDSFKSIVLNEPGTDRLLGNAWHLQFDSESKITVIVVDRNPANVFQAIHLDLNNGRLWRDLIPVDRNWVEQLKSIPSYTQEFQAAHQAPDGSLWIPHQDGLLMKRSSDSLFKPIPLLDLWTTTRYGMRHISFDGDSILWISSFHRSLFKYDRRNGALKRYPFARDSNPWHFQYAYHTLQDPNNQDRLWLGTRSQGILEFDKRTGVYRRLRSKLKIPSDAYAHLVDRSGVVWFSGRGAGLFAMNSTTAVSSRFLSEVDVNGQSTPTDVTDLQSDGNGGMLVTTYTNGLYLLDESGQVKRQLNRVGSEWLPNVSLWSVTKSSEQDLWVSSSAGVARVVGPEWRIERPPQDIRGMTPPWHQFSRSVRADKNGLIWVGSANGLARIDLAMNEWTEFQHDPSDSTSIADNFTHTIMIDSRNTLWVGHASGCVSSASATNPQRFRRYTTGSDCRVYSFFEKKDGTILVGTASGVYQIDPERTGMTPVLEFDSLADQRVNSLFEDPSGRIWIGTTQGLHILNPLDQSWIQLKDVDGFHSDVITFRIMEDEKGRIWITTASGIVRFNHHRLDVGGAAYPIHIVDVRTLNRRSKSVDASGVIRLSHDENDVLIAVSNFDYRDPASQRWFFRLRGLHEDWVPATTQNLMQYTNLHPGSYQLDIRVESRYGYDQELLDSMIIDVVPAYWQTLWFKLGFTILLVGLIIGIVWIRYRKSVEIRETRETMLHDLHDDLSSVLASMQFNVRTLQPGAEIRPAVLGRLSDSARQASDIMRDLLWTVNPKEDQWGNLVARCKEFVAMSIDDHNILLTWDVTGDESATVPLDLKKQFMLVFKEIVTNCCKHAKASNVSIRLGLGHTLHLSVTDDGIGFDTSTHHKGVGMDSIRSRLTKAQASWTLTSAPGAGTRWEIRFLIR